MEKKDIDWSNLGFGYVKTDKRYVSNYKDGSWDERMLILYSTNVQVFFSMPRQYLKDSRLIQQRTAESCASDLT